MIPRIDALIEPIVKTVTENSVEERDSHPNSALTNSDTASWQQQLASAITTPEDLFPLLDLPEQYLQSAIKAARLFPLKVTHSYLSRIKKGDINDPLLRQVLPLAEELSEDSQYSADPVGDINATVVEGLLHKYNSRVLLIPTSVCGIHCRYCFRRHYPYAEHQPSNSWQQALNYIHKDSSITEVILSGGDPLSLSNNKLFRLLDRLAEIPHIKRIRFHSRYPIILPKRIDSELCEFLKQHRCKMVMVIHCNHPNELNNDVNQAINCLNNVQVQLLNQSVLLAGVNNNVETLSHLSEILFDQGVSPYYLHQLDKVQGAQHFAVSDERAKSLILSLRKQLSGYLVPRLVREIEGQPAKQPLF